MDALLTLLAVLGVLLWTEGRQGNNKQLRKIMAAINKLEEAVAGAKSEVAKLKVAVDRVVENADPTLQTRIDAAATEVETLKEAVKAETGRIDAAVPPAPVEG